MVEVLQLGFVYISKNILFIVKTTCFKVVNLIYLQKIYLSIFGKTYDYNVFSFLGSIKNYIFMFRNIKQRDAQKFENSSF